MTLWPRIDVNIDLRFSLFLSNIQHWRPESSDSLPYAQKWLSNPDCVNCSAEKFKGTYQLRSDLKDCFCMEAISKSGSSLQRTTHWSLSFPIRKEYIVPVSLCQVNVYNRFTLGRSRKYVSNCCNVLLGCCDSEYRKPNLILSPTQCGLCDGKEECH